MTYSIVARDPETGELGVAVQSHWFSVGPIVPWARPGRRGGGHPGQRRGGLRAARAGPARARDVGAGGAQAPARRGPPGRHRARWRSSMPAARWPRTPARPAWPSPVTSRATASPARPTSWPPPRSGPRCSRPTPRARAASARACSPRSTWPRPPAAICAGRQSAAILVVPAAGDPWATVMSLRVEDHPDPLVELARLAKLDEAYRVAGEGDERLAEGRHDEASASSTSGPASSRPSQTSCASGPASAPRRSGDMDDGAGPRAGRDRGPSRVARAAAAAHARARPVGARRAGRPRRAHPEPLSRSGPRGSAPRSGPAPPWRRAARRRTARAAGGHTRGDGRARRRGGG